MAAIRLLLVSVGQRSASRPSGSGDLLAAIQAGSTSRPRPGIGRERVHQAVADDRLDEAVVHRVHAGPGHAPFDRRVGAAERAQDLASGRAGTCAARPASPAAAARCDDPAQTRDPAVGGRIDAEDVDGVEREERLRVVRPALLVAHRDRRRDALCGSRRPSPRRRAARCPRTSRSRRPSSRRPNAIASAAVLR